MSIDQELGNLYDFGTKISNKSKKIHTTILDRPKERRKRPCIGPNWELNPGPRAFRLSKARIMRLDHSGSAFNVGHRYENRGVSDDIPWTWGHLAVPNGPGNRQDMPGSPLHCFRTIAIDNETMGIRGGRGYWNASNRPGRGFVHCATGDGGVH